MGKGFASMSPEKRKRFQSIGGKRAHALGKAHTWDSKTAKEANKKGLIARKKNRESNI